MTRISRERPGQWIWISSIEVSEPTPKCWNQLSWLWALVAETTWRIWVGPPAVSAVSLIREPMALRLLTVPVSLIFR